MQSKEIKQRVQEAISNLPAAERVLLSELMAQPGSISAETANDAEGDLLSALRRLRRVALPQ